MSKRFYILIMAVAAMLAGGGCSSSYITPGGGANLAALTGTGSGNATNNTTSITELFARQPAAVFPASIATVRIQAPGYANYFTLREGGIHNGSQFSVVTVQEIEEPGDFDRLRKLPELGGLITISPLLLPAECNSERDLREAAGRLKADMLLLYTFNTTFHDENKFVSLSAISLGIFPTIKVSVHVTASAVLVDTRTGFVYAAFDANESRQLLSNVWKSDASADQARQAAEKTAFKELAAEFEKNWTGIVTRFKPQK